MLAARSEKVYEEMAEAKKQNEEATSLRIEYESRIQEAKDEARNIVEGAKKRGDQLKDEIVLEAKNESSNILAKARTDMEREKEKVLNDLKSEVVEIAMLAATKVVEKDLDENTHKNMINKFITEVGESKWKN
ncbi:F-ATPase, F0 complex, subunit B AtpF [Gottschalkia acidurici 9a]|uniref:F-ATPase, F0 complex, subunit B AtpF n=2 Tax=Clostridium acidurici TaxID=1556 RepID=K0AY05_GOTA9|nr:F-ATPase, F0 complex, subunit B AtpF [Gottschalkia acidurici 9a]